MSIEDSIVLIEARNSIGTGFIIHKDNNSSYVLTCSHVLDGTKGEGIKVGGKIAELIAYSGEQGDRLDLAILRVKEFKKQASALNLWTFSKQEDPLKIHGFYKYSQQAGTQVRKDNSIKGKLEDGDDAYVKGEAFRIWNLVITGSKLKEGCSGAPVLNQQDEVIGVVTHLEGNGEKGSAISIEALERLEPLGEIDIRPYIHIPRSERGVDYANLHDYLVNQDWEAADAETMRVMLAATDRRGFLTAEDIQDFPCADLCTIDRLWIHYSEGKFGFSVQKRIWEYYGSPTDIQADLEGWNRFTQHIGWGSWSNVTNFKSLPGAVQLGAIQLNEPQGIIAGGTMDRSWKLSPDGHLPNLRSRENVLPLLTAYRLLFSRMATCHCNIQ